MISLTNLMNVNKTLHSAYLHMVKANAKIDFLTNDDEKGDLQFTIWPSRAYAELTKRTDRPA
ncbi:hypothetical protein GCM10010912_57820 [Paenibacillus albidus]|uniref:Uncharacterized protein n=1 Tax=Paenibacillus albidus TaxID=2041023 RepID=A0A917D0M5_9BACL|nr:hypothetical protein GCM10010912_57820 [Paenibacillus albidus]